MAPNCTRCRPPCKSSVKRSHGCPGHARESVQVESSRMFLCALFASRHRFLRSAEPDIHLLSQTPKSRHRRLSLCTLPVPKQFVESLGSVISFAQSATCRTWQSAHFCSSCLFRQHLCCRSPAFFRRHEVSLLPIHGKQIRDHLPGYG
jgi:hypothetical protein